MPYLPAIWWKRIRSLAAAIFVCWHLLMLFISNAELRQHVDSWRDASKSSASRRAVSVAEKTIEASLWYESITGMDQGWALFTSPLARRAPFVATRLKFDDGSSETIKSRTEPEDPTRFLRFGDARLRKLENNVLSFAKAYSRDPLVERYVHYIARHWQSTHADDSRRPVEAVILKRIFEMPQPGQRWQRNHPVEIEELATIKLDLGS